MLTRNVNGKKVVCTPKEEAEIRAGWTENDRLAAIEAAKPKEPTDKERMDAMQEEINILKQKENDRNSIKVI